MENFKPELQGNEESSNNPQYGALKSKLNLSHAIEKTVFWIGLICAFIAMLAYILIVIVMVVGFVQEQRSFIQDFVFAGVTGAVGVLIMQFAKIQGIAFAKSEPEVKYWDQKWKVRRTKDRKYHSINSFWWKSTTMDIVLKLTTLTVMSVGLTYVFIQASNDPTRIMFAVFNIIMFLGFGLLSLSKAYTFYCTEHVEWIKHQLEERVKAEEQAIIDKANAEKQAIIDKENAEKQAIIDAAKAEIEAARIEEETARKIESDKQKELDKPATVIVQLNQDIQPTTEETASTEPVEIKEEQNV